MPALHYRIDPAKLVGTNAAVDPDASAARFLAELRPALERELPGWELDLGAGPAALRVEGVEDPATWALRVEGVARAVRHCGTWVVYE
ncbi:MAG TPA: hypothetical protein RMH85_24905 [Polyangiaceae bacterium LLY-WYZ-15_(1-7)]|nr:hypothetical protein [Myxococcales bacterium]MAT26585.1 hypothetical protein [Sandaracinus sp.]HJK93570.1 hypothetical protein [Polyangiaceae bacterium LLY-WYZ-15_(1-7)]HJL02530.1 hypothetical protein [Polyangiaceae bacterium LLY-WYZ-15_(1-7)]HJL11739.1 hypothetical protein [Polyangiaceae bacterium LLY-WYZ-15_(1-7)]